MTDREIMQQALDALEIAEVDGNCCYEATELLRTLLTQPAPQPDAYGYASRLAVAIWEQHYKDVAPQWKPLDDLMGVLTQIDNMTTGLTRLAQPEQEPVAYPDGDVVGPCICGSWPGGKCLKCPRITTPPQRKPLTDEKVGEIYYGITHQRATIPGSWIKTFARAIEAAHGIKEKNNG